MVTVTYLVPACTILARQVFRHFDVRLVAIQYVYMNTYLTTHSLLHLDYTRATQYQGMLPQTVFSLKSGRAVQHHSVTLYLPLMWYTNCTKITNTL